MQVADRPPSLLIRQALERAGLASLLADAPGTCLTRTQIESLLKPEHSLLTARIALQRRLSAWGLTTTYALRGVAEDTGSWPTAPDLADWPALLAWSTAHPEGVGPEPVQTLALAAAAGLDVATAARALRGTGLTALAPALMPQGDADSWLDIMVSFAEAGFALTVAIPFAADETALSWADRACQLRRWQATKRFAVAMLPVPAESGLRPAMAVVPTGFGVLQMVALCRILVDNIPHLTIDGDRIGVKLGQVALSFGADDWVGTAAEAASEAGDPALLIELIGSAGQEPLHRDAAFTVCRS